MNPLARSFRFFEFSFFFANFVRKKKQAHTLCVARDRPLPCHYALHIQAHPSLGK
jgi:hypothetical protein